MLFVVSPGRNITEKLPEFGLFIPLASSDGDSDFVSRNNGEPDICIVRGSTEKYSNKQKQEIIQLVLMVKREKANFVVNLILL